MNLISDVISSRQNPIVKFASSLADKKGRAREKSFLAEGEKLTYEAAGCRLSISHVFVIQSKKEQLLPRILDAFSDKMYDDTKLIVLTDEAFDKISTEKSPQGVISVIKYLDFFCELDIIYNVEKYFSYNDRVIALNSLRDPSNLGAIIRSAVAFGVSHIVLSSDCVDPYNPKTVRAAMGALFKIKITFVSDFAAFVKDCISSGRNVYAAELRDGALPLDELALSSRDVVIIGNEGHGIDENISSLCTASVYIPISAMTESLNASVAASILMWELSKHKNEV